MGRCGSPSAASAGSSRSASCAASGRRAPSARTADTPTSLTRAARIEIERLQWPEGRPDRPAELPPSAPIHQLATHDLFAAFLRAGNPALPEGIFAWLPERACGQLFGFLRADALAGIRVADRTLTMFIERDLGTERGEVIAEKVRRYRSLFARAPEGPIVVGFVVESARRASTIQSLASRYATDGLSFVTIVARARANRSARCPLVRWRDTTLDSGTRG